MLASAESQGCNPARRRRVAFEGRLKVANKGPRGASGSGRGSAAFPSPAPRRLRASLVSRAREAHDSRQHLHGIGGSGVHTDGRTWRLEQVDANVSVEGLSFEDLFAEQHARLYRALYLIVGNSP